MYMRMDRSGRHINFFYLEMIRNLLVKLSCQYLFWTFLNFYPEFYVSREDFSFLEDITTSVAGFMFLYSPADSMFFSCREPIINCCPVCGEVLEVSDGLNNMIHMTLCFWWSLVDVNSSVFNVKFKAV